MLRDTRTVKDAVYLIDDNGFGSKFYNGAPSAWDMDARARCKPVREIRGNLLCTDENGLYDVYAKRELVPHKSGRAGFANCFTIHYGSDFYIRFHDASENDRKITLEISADSGYFTVNGIKTAFAAQNKTYFFSVDFDFDKDTALVYINNKNAGLYNLMSKGISLFSYGVKAGKKTCVQPGFTRLWINYLLVDKCYCYIEEPLYDKWNFCGNENASAGLVANKEGHSYAIITKDGNEAYVARAFDKTKGKIDFEVKYATEKAGGSIKISLLDGENEVVSVTDNGEALLSDSNVLRNHHVNVWQTLRMVADSESKRCDVYLNGKKCGTIGVYENTDAFDGIKLAFADRNGGMLKFLNAVVSEVQPEPEDYVPAPVKREKKDYYVGINVCSLWRSGTHTGWDTITPYKENKTYLGWYDEGLPEVSDWEIKWLYENGVDAEFYCWYNDRSNCPIHSTGLSDAIHNGHFKAKYADYMKFAIIWEAANGAPTCEEGFRNHMVPYWMDYFFSDHRYFTLDNKVVVSVFGHYNLIKDFGSPEKVAENFDFVREEVKKLGYDGALFIACASPTEEVKRCGFDGVHAYSWAMGGYSVEFSKTRINKWLNQDFVHPIPTVSSGFNGIAWDYERTGQMTTSDMGEMVRWIKEDVLPENEGKEDWKKKFVMLSTWNEYGEGTYMCPAELNGFGYLEEIKKAFTEEDKSFANVRPNENQLKRLGYMYPSYRSILRCGEYEEKDYPDKHIGFLPIDKNAYTVENDLELENKNGILYGNAPKYDPKMFLATDIDSDVVKNVRITMKGGIIGDEVIIYYKTENDSEWSESRSARAYFDSHDMKAYNIYVGASKHWKGKITELRIDPTSLESSFEIESMELLADDRSLGLIIDGNKCRLPYSPKLCGGKVCVPYEHGGDVQKYMNLCHEWYKDEGKLILLYDKTELIFEIGKDYATYGDEKISLSAKTEMFDGLPLLELDALAKAFRFNVETNGRNVNVTKQNK